MMSRIVIKLLKAELIRCMAELKLDLAKVDVVLGTGLLDMYAKCGYMESAMKVFDEMPHRGAMTWTALIGGLATSGHGEQASQVFNQMEKSGLKPDTVTFIGILTNRSFTGLADKGFFHFNSMSSAYNIQPTVEHYGYMLGDIFSEFDNIL